jgi:hypothetical protein
MSNSERPVVSCRSLGSGIPTRRFVENQNQPFMQFADADTVVFFKVAAFPEADVVDRIPEPRMVKNLKRIEKAWFPVSQFSRTAGF